MKLSLSPWAMVGKWFEISYSRAHVLGTWFSLWYWREVVVPWRGGSSGRSVNQKGLMSFLWDPELLLVRASFCKSGLDPQIIPWLPAWWCALSLSSILSLQCPLPWRLHHSSVFEPPELWAKLTCSLYKVFQPQIFSFSPKTQTNTVYCTISIIPREPKVNVLPNCSMCTWTDEDCCFFC